MTSDEQAILDRLLEVDFPGRDELREQLSRASVRTIDAEKSIEITTESTATARVRGRVPVEARYLDDDGVPVEILLHVVEGKASELEIYRADGKSIRRRPRPAELTVELAPA